MFEEVYLPIIYGLRSSLIPIEYSFTYLKLSFRRDFKNERLVTSIQRILKTL